MSSITLRILQATDAHLFQVLRLHGLQHAPESFTSSYEEEVDRPLAVVAERLAPQQSPASWVWGAFAGEVLAGLAGMYQRLHVKERHLGTIWGVYVAPTHRQQGIARGLLEQIIVSARAVPDLLQLTLAAGSANPAALALYRSVGFRAVGVMPRALIVNGKALEETLMVCDLHRRTSA